MLAEAEEEDAEEDPVVATGEADDNIIGQRKTHSGRTPTFLFVVSRFQLNSSTVKLSTVTDGHRCFRLPSASTSASPKCFEIDTVNYYVACNPVDGTQSRNRQHNHLITF